MITITDPGVNFCTCLTCRTSFFFDKEDIKQGERWPYVKCPHCSHKMLLGWNKEYFMYVERRKKQ